MTYDPDQHHRGSIRLKGYDYSRPGAYFVTICTEDRRYLFGDVVDGEMRLNDAGRIVGSTLDRLGQRFPGVELDQSIVMPNHVHAIIVLVRAQFIAPKDVGMGREGAINRAPTLGEVVRAFKAITARLIRSSGRTDFAWQRNYYEHVIRDEEDLDLIRRYIVNNPLQWHLDVNNPEHKINRQCNRVDH